MLIIDELFVAAGPCGRGWGTIDLVSITVTPPHAPVVWDDHTPEALARTSAP
ncbi:MAG: hypothetical protein ACR2KK_09190 [Acidimicrobiales bacterium]